MTYFARLPRYWLTRLYCALSAATNVITSIEPRSLTAQVVSATGGAGDYWLAALGAVALVAVLDVIVNDLMPEGYSLGRTRRYRHLTYMALAVLLCGLASATYTTVGWTTLLITWWVDAAMATTIAFVDLFARHRGGRTP